MRTRKSSHFVDPHWSLPRVSIAALIASSLAVAPAQGAFHLWQIREVYTDASGQNQFIELFNGSGFDQPAVSGHMITVSDGATTHMYTVPSNVVNTVNQALLFGTSSITNFGSPKPDFVIPDNFLLPNGATITFFGQNSGPYTALPTDGTNSRTWGDGNAVNSPQNILGQTNTIVIPNSPRPLLSAARGTSGPIQFQYSTQTGINYVVERATGLTNFSAVVTNPGTGGILTFEETDGSASQRYYRVRLQ